MPQHYTQKPTSHSGLQCTTPSSSPPLPIPFWPFLLTPLLPNPLLPGLHLQLTLLLFKYTRHTYMHPCFPLPVAHSSSETCRTNSLIPQIKLSGMLLRGRFVCSLPFIYLFDHLLVPVGTYTNVFYT